MGYVQKAKAVPLVDPGPFGGECEYNFSSDHLDLVTKTTNNKETFWDKTTYWNIVGIANTLGGGNMPIIQSGEDSTRYGAYAIAPNGPSVSFYFNASEPGGNWALNTNDKYHYQCPESNTDFPTLENGHAIFDQYHITKKFVDKDKKPIVGLDVQIILPGNGPTLAELVTDSEGKVEFGYANTIGNVFNRVAVNRKFVDSLVVEAFTTVKDANNKYYQIKNPISLDLKNGTSEFNKKALEQNGQHWDSKTPYSEIMLGDADQIDTLPDRRRDLTIKEQIVLSSEGDACGNATNIPGAILVGLCTMTVAVREWAMSIMCYAQDKFLEVLGQTLTVDNGSCTDTKYKNDATMNKLIQ